MDRIEKFIRKLKKDLALKIIFLRSKIEANDLANLDIKKLEAETNLYRVRSGKIRIIFEKGVGGNKIISIDYRKDVYR